MHFRMVQNLDEIIEKIIVQYDLETRTLTNVLNIDIPLIFLDKMKDINSITGQCQIEHIQSVLSCMLDEQKKSNLEHVKKIHLIKCIKLCKKYNLPIDAQLA